MARGIIYEAELANHGVHFIQEVQDDIIVDGNSESIGTAGVAKTCHYGINQGKAAATNIQAPSSKTLLIPQIGVLMTGGGNGEWKIMASDTVDTDDGTQLYTSGTLNLTGTVYVPYPLELPANKYLTLVYVTAPGGGRTVEAVNLTVIEEN